MSGVVLTLAIALILLASITRLETRLKEIEDYLRIQSIRHRASIHDQDDPEPEPKEDEAPTAGE